MPLLPSRFVFYGHECFAYIYVCVPCACLELVEIEEVIGSLELELWEGWVWCWEPSPGPLQKPPLQLCFSFPCLGITCCKVRGVTHLIVRARHASLVCIRILGLDFGEDAVASSEIAEVGVVAKAGVAEAGVAEAGIAEAGLLHSYVLKVFINQLLFLHILLFVF